MMAIGNVAAPDGGSERPLTARSAMASLLLGMHPPRMRAAQLVRWCGLFGIAAGTARVALHRMAARGELTVQDGVYELAGPLAARQRAQDWSLEPVPEPWWGEWRLAVVAADARPAVERQRLREAMRKLRFAPLREGVWTRPDNLPPSAAPEDALAVADDQCRWLRARPDGDVADLVAPFAPQVWSQQATLLRDRLDDLVVRLDDGPDDVLAHGFVLGAAALAHVRTDPLLPDALVDQPWPGPALRDAYQRFQGAFATAVAEWFAR